MCRLCDFITLSANDIKNHILTIHNIDLNNIPNKKNIEDYILSKFKMFKYLYLMKLFLLFLYCHWI